MSFSSESAAAVVNVPKNSVMIPFLFQLFSAYHCVDEEKLAKHLSSLTETSWSSDSIFNLFVLFNDSFRPMGFEIRTAVIREQTPQSTQSSSSSSSTAQVKRYHSLLNINEDTVAREVGSSFQPEELKAFTKVLEKLLIVRKMTTSDVIEICQEQMSERRKQTILQDLVTRWEDSHWLMRSESNNLLYIGPRSHLELRQLLEAFAESSAGQDDNAESQTSDRILQSLPQIIIHG